MDVREKLIDLIVQGNIMSFGKSESFAEIIADNLITHGVTVQEWISVDEKLPEETCECLITGKLGVVFLTYYSDRHRSFNATDDDDGDRWKLYDVTHWMPLPQPPKGE